MTAKEKAEDMFITYRFILSHRDAPLGTHKDAIAKLCASTAIQIFESSLTENDIKDWWKEVKQELEKI